MATDQESSRAAGESTEEIRRGKLERLRAEGIEPSPREGFPGRAKISAIHVAHDPEQLEEGEQAGFSSRNAGRVVQRHRQRRTVCLGVRDLPSQSQGYAR